MISTYTIIAGNMKCPNNCPICISKMTPSHGIGYEEPDFNWEKFRKATRIAIMRGARNVLITGKGEPTLFPRLVKGILFELAESSEYKQFERIELQTEGSNIANSITDDVLRKWKGAGLDLIALSIYHYDSRKNAGGFGHFGSDGGYDLPALIKRLNAIGFLVRLSCVMRLGYIDNPNLVYKLIGFCKENDVFQLTLRIADVPDDPLDTVVAHYVKTNRPEPHNVKAIKHLITSSGKLCYTLPHGVSVYEVEGQNVSITTGLGKPGDNRQLIFFPQGWLTMSWETVQGSRII